MLYNAVHKNAYFFQMENLQIEEVISGHLLYHDA